MSDNLQAVVTPGAAIAPHDAAAALVHRLQVAQGDMSEMMNGMIARGAISFQLHEAFDDYGHFCQRIACDVYDACKACGMVEPDS